METWPNLTSIHCLLYTFPTMLAAKTTIHVLFIFLKHTPYKQFLRLAGCLKLWPKVEFDSLTSPEVTYLANLLTVAV